MHTTQTSRRTSSKSSTDSNNSKHFLALRLRGTKVSVCKVSSSLSTCLYYHIMRANIARLQTTQKDKRYTFVNTHTHTLRMCVCMRLSRSFQLPSMVHGAGAVAVIAMALCRPPSPSFQPPSASHRESQTQTHTNSPLAGTCNAVNNNFEIRFFFVVACMPDKCVFLREKQRKRVIDVERP